MDGLWLWMVAAVIAYIVKGLCGFANTLVFSSILSFGTSNVNITPVESLLGCISNTIYAFKERRSINWKQCLPVAALVILGSIPGMFFLKHADTGVIKIIFGFVIIFIGIEMLFRELKPTKMKSNKVVLLIIGLLSGVLCGLYGIGALLSAYFSRVTDNSKAFKANICVVFLIDHIFRLTFYVFLDILTLETVKLTAMVLPFMLLGLFVGMKCCKFLDERKIKLLVVVMLIISGIALVINSL